MYSIAIDGPSSSGKSSVADELALRLNILHLNTGDLYRAIGYFAYKNGIANEVDESNNPIISTHDVRKLTNNVFVDVKYIGGRQHTFVNAEDVTDYLHTPVISDYSSRVSQIPEVRKYITTLQRSIANTQSVVMEGRDITSQVLPNSKYKFFITASPEVRARRRYEENISKGIKCTYTQALSDILARDKRDTTRKISPLVITKDSVVIDTSNLSVEDTVNKILSYIKE